MPSNFHTAQCDGTGSFAEKEKTLMYAYALRRPSRKMLGVAVTLSLVVALLVVWKSPVAHASCNGAPTCGMTFAQTATASNTSGYAMTLSNAFINGRSDRELFVTQAWPGAYDAHPIEIWYNGRVGRWILSNQDLQPIPLSTTFFVSMLPMGIESLPDYQFTQVTSTTSNVTANWVTIDSAVTNGNPYAVVYATEVGNGVYDPHAIGAYYTSGKWAIFNEDGSAMPLGVTFDVSLNAGNASGFNSIVQIATASNINSYVTYIHDPALNGQPGAQPQVMQVWDVNGVCGCVYNNHPTTVWYDSSAGLWTIYNVDLAPMPVGAQFFVAYS